jgi:hypothetical protein
MSIGLTLTDYFVGRLNPITVKFNLKNLVADIHSDDGISSYLYFVFGYDDTIWGGEKFLTF